MFSGIIQVLLGIIGLSIVVLVHEGGHYAAAQMVGIDVETFSIGFGRRLFGFTRGETDYRFSLIPLGGYCRFYGEQSFREAIEQKMDHIPGEPGEFYGASPLKRILVSFSGPLANLVFAVVVFTMISWIGYQEYYTEPKIILASGWTGEEELWPADYAGLQDGDVILAVDGRNIKKFNELRQFLIFRPGEKIGLEVDRNGKTLHLEIEPRLNRETGTALIGVLSWIDPVISTVIPGSNSEKSGLKSGDRIISLNGREVPHTVALNRILQDCGEENVSLGIRRKGEDMEIRGVSPENLLSDITFQVISGPSASMNPLQALFKGSGETLDTLVSTLKSLRMLFMGIELQNAVSGPVRLITDTGAVVAEGFRNGLGPGLLWSFELMSLISVSLAFLNLLPIPVLDGGQIVLFTYELIRNRKLNPKAVYRYQFIGTIIVLLIALAATTGDFIHYNQH